MLPVFFLGLFNDSSTFKTSVFRFYHLDFIIFDKTEVLIFFLNHIWILVHLLNDTPTFHICVQTPGGYTDVHTAAPVQTDTREGVGPTTQPVTNQPHDGSTHNQPHVPPTDTAAGQSHQ